MWCLSRDSIFEVNKPGKNAQFIGIVSIDITKEKEREIFKLSLKRKIWISVETASKGFPKSLI